MFSSYSISRAFNNNVQRVDSYRQSVQHIIRRERFLEDLVDHLLNCIVPASVVADFRYHSTVQTSGSDDLRHSNKHSCCHTHTLPAMPFLFLDINRS